MEIPKAPMEEIMGSWSVHLSLELQGNQLIFIQSGQDLSGNTFWEFRDALNSNRNRRIVKYSPKTHYGDVKLTRTNPYLQQREETFG